MLEGEVKAKVKVEIWEYERGWGSSLEETKVFESLFEAEMFVAGYNSENTEAVAPDWYMVARIA